MANIMLADAYDRITVIYNKLEKLDRFKPSILGCLEDHAESIRQGVSTVKVRIDDRDKDVMSIYSDLGKLEKFTDLICKP